MWNLLKMIDVADGYVGRTRRRHLHEARSKIFKFCGPKILYLEIKYYSDRFL